MTAEKAQELAAAYAGWNAATVEPQLHGVLVREPQGRTSFFTSEDNFYRFIDRLAYAVEQRR